MSLELVRVDDRLIHGQVVVGWGPTLRPDLFVLASDEVAQNDWEQELYRLGVPEEIAVEFPSIEEAARSVERWANGTRRTVIIVSDVESLVRLCERAPAIRKVNLGGVHADGERRQRLPYMFLDDAEANRLNALAARGIEITAQDLPNAAPVELADLI